MDFIRIPEPTYIDTEEGVMELLGKCMAAKVVAVDTETVSNKIPYWEDMCLYMSIAIDETSRYFMPRQFIHYFKPVLESKKIIKALHNAKFDMHRLNNMGIEVCSPIADTLLMDHLLYEENPSRKLEDLSRQYFDIPMASYKDVMGKHDSRAVEPGHEIWEAFLDYGSLDALVTLKLFRHLKAGLEKKKLWKGEKETLYDLYWQYEEPQLNILYFMERKGIKVDVEQLEKTRKTLTEEMDEVAADICKLAMKPINPGSPQQVAELMFGKVEDGNFGITPYAFTNTGKYKCDEKILKNILKDVNEHLSKLGEEDTEEIEFYSRASGVAKKVIQYKKASKLRGTYAEGLQKKLDPSGFLHTNYMPLTKAGRLSSSGPNLQNIPSARKDPHNIRGAFVPDDDDFILIGADYSQLEWRVMAHASRDESLVDTFVSGLDQHSVTGALMMGIPYEDFYKRYKEGDAECKMIRSAGKAVSFGYLYGGTAWTVSESLTEALGRDVSRQEAQDFIDKYKGGYPGVVRQVEAFQDVAKKTGQTRTIIGRFVHFPDIKSKNWSKKNHALNQAINCPIQGSAADIVKKAMINSFNHPRLIDIGCTLRMQIHDELIFNVPKVHAEEAAQIIKDIMEHPFDEPLAVPLTAEPEIADNWGDLK